MSILALDLGRTTGWARSNGSSGTFSTLEHDDHGMALALFSDWLEAMLDEMPLICLAVERGFGGNNAVGRLTTAMELTAHALAWSRDVPRTDRSAVEVRKWLLGPATPRAKDYPSKAARVRAVDAAILMAVQARGFRSASEHAADAAALLAMVEQRPVRGLAA